MTSSYAKSLKERWQHLLDQEPKLRIRDAARNLGVPEAELVALGEGVTATQLRPDWEAILSELRNAGPLMALTRNEHVVHERHGSYSSPQFYDDVCIVEDNGFKAALFLSEWATGFYVREPSRGEIRPSLHFFNRNGDAVHKIYLTPRSQNNVFNRLAENLRWENPPAVQWEYSGRQVQVNGRGGELWSHRSLVGWGHDEWGQSVKTPNLALRSECLKVIPIAVDVGEQLLSKVASLGLPVRIVVGNSGALQIHSGTIQKIIRTGPWINVLDDQFNLHFRDQRLGSAWWVNDLNDHSQSLCWLDADQQVSLQIFSVDSSVDWESCIAQLIDSASLKEGNAS